MACSKAEQDLALQQTQHAVLTQKRSWRLTGLRLTPSNSQQTLLANRLTLASSIYLLNIKWGFLVNLITAAFLSMPALFISNRICNSSVNLTARIFPICLYQTMLHKLLCYIEFCRWCSRGDDTHESKMAPKGFHLQWTMFHLEVSQEAKNIDWGESLKTYFLAHSKWKWNMQ